MPIISNTSPVGLSPEAWAAALRIDWSQDYVPEYEPGKDWREWATRLIADNLALQGAAPDPLGFATFEEWAIRVFEATS